MMEYIATFDDTLELSLIYEDENILEMTLDETVNPGDDFELGAAPSAKLEVSLIDADEGIIFEQEVIKPYVGLVLENTIEYVPLGVFVVDDIKKEKRTIKLVCFDNMIKLEKPYFSELTYPASINAVAQEIAQKAGVTLATTNLPTTQISNLSGYTLREAIGFIAAFMGGFAKINRNGQLEITSYTDSDTIITGDNYITLKTAERDYSIGRLTCYVGEDEEGNMQILTAGTTGHEVIFECPIMTQEQLNSLHATLSQVSYMPFTMEWQGNPALMAGDKITIIDVKENTYNTLLMRQKISYRGGLKATAEAVGKTEQAQATRTIGTLTRRIDRKAQIARTAAEQYADRIAQDIADGKYKGTFIDETTIYSPIIAGMEGRFTGELKVGVGNDLAGISGEGTNNNSIRFWAGHANKNQAPFRVTQDGTMYAVKGKFSGEILAATVISSPTINGGTINAATLNSVDINTDRGINIGNFLSLPISRPTNISDASRVLRGHEGIRFGPYNAATDGWSAAISVVDMGHLVGITDIRPHMVIRAHEVAIDATNFRAGNTEINGEILLPNADGISRGIRIGASGHVISEYGPTGNSRALCMYANRNGNFAFLVRSHLDHANYRNDFAILSNGNTRVYNNFSVDGTKSCIVETESYGKRLMYALETPDNRFVAYIEKNLPEGEHWIEICPMFLETISEYFIVPHVQNASDVIILEREKSKFRVWVKGHRAEVVFEVNGKRKGFEHIYMEPVLDDD